MRPEQVPDSFEIIEGDERPGHPLYPNGGDSAPTDHGNHPVSKGDRIVLYVEVGSDLAKGTLDVFAVDEGDLITVPAGVHPGEADEVFRIDSRLRQMILGAAYSEPEFDADEGEITTTRQVGSFGVTPTVREVRKIDATAEWHPKQRFNTL